MWDFVTIGILFALRFLITHSDTAFLIPSAFSPCVH